MVADVVLMRGFASGVGWLMVVAVLVPPPLDGRAAGCADVRNVLRHVGEVESRIAILVREPIDPAAHEREAASRK